MHQLQGPGPSPQNLLACMQVWAVLTDYDHLVEFVPNLEACKKLSGGTKTRSAPPGRFPSLSIKPAETGCRPCMVGRRQHGTPSACSDTLLGFP